MHHSQLAASAKQALRLWFGVSQPVSRLAYVASGASLLLFKYAVEALVIWWLTAQFFAPWDYLNPVLSARVNLVQPAPQWLPWVWFFWSLPFFWIAVSMSVRRMADAGLSPWLGLLVFVPLFNLALMLSLGTLPTAKRYAWVPEARTPVRRDRAGPALLSIGASLAFGAVMLFLSVYVFATYGPSLFMGTPLVMGATAAYVYNHAVPRSYSSSVGIALAAMSVAMLMLLLFALEGVICIVMAAPLLLPLGALGGVMGKAISDATRRPAGGLLTVILLLPVSAGVDALRPVPIEREIVTSVEIDASASRVWDHVLAFEELPQQRAWYFRWGIACPERARIRGAGVGATRFCEFTTGTFVEPITAWKPGRRLAFDVTDQPAPMFELSPYAHVHPPHLHGYLRSKRGEFVLTALDNGRTRLEGHTWYEFDMQPQFYWTLWSDSMIHSIHERVLLHIKDLSEASPE